MTLDYISGILVGYKEKTLNSKKGFKGLCKKVMILIIFDLLIWTILTLMTLDYISGILVGYKEKTLNSKKGFKGLCKKVMILIIICCSSLISQILKNFALRDIVIIFYCSTEILSILENAGKIGVPIPQKLKEALEQCTNFKKFCIARYSHNLLLFNRDSKYTRKCRKDRSTYTTEIKRSIGAV